MKKRWIVSAAALSAVALAVTGCGASASDSSISGNSGDSAASGDAGELYVYNWGEYIDETVIDEFEEETGIKVVYDLYETNEEMYPVIEAGGIAYDAVCPSDFMIQKMREHDLLAEINFDNVPNIDQIDPLYMELSGKQVRCSVHLGHHRHPLQQGAPAGAWRSGTDQMGRPVG